MSQESQLSNVLCGIAFVILLVTFAGMIGHSLYLKGYRSGQIDAMNNKYEYKVVSNDDGTTRWKNVETYSLKTKD
jgi:hypothetical protein